MVYKIAYNGCFGGFSLSEEAVKLARKISGDERWAGITLRGELWSDTKELCDYFYGHLGCEHSRHDPVLIEVIETLGEKANGSCANLKVYETINPIYRIDEYDGNETVMQPNDYDYIDATNHQQKRNDDE